MIKVSDIIGFSILCTDNTKFVGEVKDAILDLRECKLVGLILDYGSIIHHTKVIDFNSIYQINRKNIVVKYKRNIQQMSSFDLSKEFIKKNESILGIEVVGEEENLLGFIQDVLFEEKSGNILGFVITNGIIDDIFDGVEILPIDGTISFQRGRFVVSKSLKKNILRNVGGLKKLLELEH